VGHPEGYAFDPITLTSKLRDMESIMRTGIRFAGEHVKTLWHEWQPFAVAAVEERKEGAKTYAAFDQQKFQQHSRALHRALEDDYAKLKRYFEEIGYMPLTDEALSH